MPTIEDPHLDIDTIGNIVQGIHSLRIHCFPKPTPFIWNTGASCFEPTQFNNDLHEVVYSNQRHLKRYKFLKTVVTDSNFYDSDIFFKISAEFSDEECAFILYNLLNYDCMKLNEEELCLFNNLSARSASWQDNYSGQVFVT